MPLEDHVQPLVPLLVVRPRGVVVGDAALELVAQPVPVAVRDGRVGRARRGDAGHAHRERRVREQLVGVDDEREHVRPYGARDGLEDEAACRLALEPVGDALEVGVVLVLAAGHVPVWGGGVGVS